MTWFFVVDAPSPVAEHDYAATVTIGDSPAGLQCVLEYPLEAVQSVEYRDGRLVIDVADEESWLVFDDISVDGEGTALENFAEADARRFVEEFDRVKRL